MTKFAKLTAAALATATPATAQDTYRGYETPRYSVIAKQGAIELRSYEPALLAQVRVQGGQSQALRQGFRILAGYIFGGNTSADKVAMTTPVTQIQSTDIDMTTPVTQSTEDGIWTISFMMPQAYRVETLPTPVEDRITFVQTAPTQQIAISFSGWATAARLISHEAALKGYADQNGHIISGPAQYAFYDDPMTLPWKRRNEISFVIE